MKTTAAAKPDFEISDSRILIIDDQTENIRFLEDVLSSAGFNHVRATTNAPSAVAIWLEFRPDLILLDLHMPEMSGIEVMEAVGARLGEDEYLPILVLTSDVSRDAKEKAFSAGAADFLIKPCSPGDIVPRTRALLRTRAKFKRLAWPNGAKR